jgi:hypothetical protein
MKVDKYNELLEDIYQREVELTKIKSALVDLREEIAGEARLLDETTSDETRDAAAGEGNEEAAEEEEAKQLSDSSSSKKVNLKKVYKKTKGKGKGHIKRSKMADSELDAEWDYKLELLRSDESVKKERRASLADGFEKEVEMVPLRAKTGLTTSH